MTTQTPQPEAPENPVTERVSRLEGIAEDTRHRLDDLSRGQTALDAKIDILRAESHAENQATNDKIDRLGETIRAEHRADYQALDAKIDTLRVETHEKIDALRAETLAKIDAHHAETRSELTQIRSDQNRQTFLILGAMGALAAFISALATLFAFLG